MATYAKKIATELLNSAGIQINGNHSWDIKIYNEAFYSRVLKDNALGLGESYMDKWWDCEQLDQFFEKILLANLSNKIQTNKFLLLKIFFSKIINFQTKKNAFMVGKTHYDLPISLFKMMLDQRMVYTCGYWPNANDLEEAQLYKLELTCKKLMLKPNMRLLDIGCGFGALAKYAAENYGVEVVGVTISEQQYRYAKELCKALPIDIRLQDYRSVDGKFDRVVSLGMFEHVGHLNYHDYMHVVKKCLQDDGLFLLHTIGSNKTNFRTNEWTQKYIFPNGMLPSIKQIGEAIEDYFVMEDWHNFGSDYDKTLMAWYHNFAKNWQHLKTQFDERFYRMWRYYLLSSAAGFRVRELQLWQIVLSPSGIAGGYFAAR